MNLKKWQIKILKILILISLVSCNTSVVVIKGDNNEVNQRQKMDSLQLIKNNAKLPLRWKRKP